MPFICYWQFWILGGLFYHTCCYEFDNAVQEYNSLLWCLRMSLSVRKFGSQCRIKVLKNKPLGLLISMICRVNSAKKVLPSVLNCTKTRKGQIMCPKKLQESESDSMKCYWNLGHWVSPTLAWLCYTMRVYAWCLDHGPTTYHKSFPALILRVCIMY